MMRAGMAKFKVFWSNVVKVLLIFFVSYGVLQSTSASLKIKNPIIIGILFVALCIQIILCMIIDKILILPKKNNKSIWQYIKPFDYFMAAFLIVNAIWILVIPKMNGFSVSDAIAEVGMIATFILYFPLAILIRLKEIDFKFIVKVFYWSTFALAIWHCTLWTCEAIFGGACDAFFDFIGKIPFIRVGEYITGWGIVRVTISSSILLSAGLLLNFKAKKPLSPWIFIRICVFIYAILGTYLKSLWFGVAAGVALVFVYLLFLLITRKTDASKLIIKNVSIVMAMVIISTVLLSSTAFKGSALNRLVNSFINTGGITSNIEDVEDAENKFNKEQDKIGAIVSNNIKIEQTEKLIERWKLSPLLGFGYGSSVPGYYRSDTQLFSYEMTMFALLMKVGIVGMAAWAILAAWVFISIAINNKKKIFNTVVWAAIAGAFLVSIQTNPLLFSANSINLIMFLVLYAVHSSMNKKAKDENQ